MTENKPKQFQGEVPELKELIIQGTTYYTTYTRKYENRKKWTKPDEKKIISFIPGTVKNILVKEGDHMMAAEKLIVLEAMKMMNTIYSPFDGIIKSIYVKEGDRVPKGTIMIEFE